MNNTITYQTHLFFQHYETRLQFHFPHQRNASITFLVWHRRMSAVRSHDLNNSP